MTRESQEFKTRKKRKIIAGCAFLAIIFFITLLKGGSLFQKDIEVLPKTGAELSSGQGMTSWKGGAGAEWKDGAGADGTTGAEGSEEGTAGPDGTEPNNGFVKGAAGQEPCTPAAVIVVDVAGAVKKPGILVLAEGSRVYEALASAGGVTDKAQLRDINQAELLSDGEKLYIPTAEEYEDGFTAAGSGNGKASAARSSAVSGSGAQSFSGAQSSAASSKTAKTGKVNINTAGSPELQTLTGVGPAMAERILSYRKENGSFRAIEDLKNVKGIGNKTFEKLKEFICVR